MCRPKTQRTSTEMLGEGYTGATVQLNSSSSQIGGGWHRRTPHHLHHVPFWLLWLIWPLIGVAKVAWPALIEVVAATSQVMLPLLPLVLIGIGVALLWRK